MEYVATYISHSQELSDQQISKITNKIESQFAIKSTRSKRLGKRANDTYFIINDSKNVKNVISEIIDYYSKEIDISIQKNDENRKFKKMMVFDMDSTLIYQEVIELIASYADVEDKVREITNRAMNNEIDFKESLKQRVQLLKGLKIDTLYDDIKEKIVVTKGVPELVKFMQLEQGTKFSVLSGGFIQFADYIGDKLKFDYRRANLLEVDDEGRLTGNTIGEIVDGECKANTIQQLCSKDKFDIDIKSTVMVGDGGNDLRAMATAGFGIAWNAKPIVQQQAPSRLNTDSMLDILYMFGYTDDEIESRLSN
ncbi:hypothetical protein TPHA_0A04910 [Tetrapisispora phaffii CBS 4417]|uniref:phosphoserine phosphatase n=1 Tax=Tetrapisispora phaffii (strain ATCC 24235 / CBS 4417 / NBRC 1672 / NRRL Y-8282 / UCD 70-5) TaxID=1071381 RepID=G8BNT8_TETPH|nr:hypothetical protein TPHA_0A04910 [Tetrapisispora phaffii CBS 4417]CCE61566.1 hypothetical protein TPHA_0A04910 [Tetrapisispora phaffii CBS 4417]